jgi:hypothetical protein
MAELMVGRLTIARSHIAGNHPAELVSSWQLPNER